MHSVEISKLKIQRQSTNCLNGEVGRLPSARRNASQCTSPPSFLLVFRSFVRSFLFLFLTLSFVCSFVCLIHSNSKCDSRPCPYLHPWLVTKWLLIAPMEKKKKKTNKQTKEKNETSNLPMT